METTNNQMTQRSMGVSEPIEKGGQIENGGSVTGPNRLMSVIRWVLILCILAALLTIVHSLPLDQAMSAAKGWIASLGFWGPVVLVLLYIVATILFVPGTILTLAAGAMFGLGVGTAVVSVGSTIGASLAFLIARYGARDKVAEMAKRNRRFGAIDRAIAEGGWKIVGLLRLSPAIPFNLQNYLYGLTPVRFLPYAVTSWIAMLPGTFLFVYIGHVTGAAVGADRQRSTAEWAMLGVGFLATVVVTVYVTRLAGRKLNEQVDESSMSEEAVEASQDPKSKSGPSVRGTMLLASVAVVLVSAATYVCLHAGQIERSLASLFGPPQVEMQEAYAANPSGPTVDHTALNELLEKHVDDDGWVDYSSLESDESKLDVYLKSIAIAPFDELGRDEKLTLLINGYNAATLRLILDHMPLASIMDIPEADRWDAVRWNIGGHTWSLNQIEHEQIRPKFTEPRIHFALVCAAVGCPPLRNEAYQADRLERQLNEQAEYVHHHSTWFQFDQENSKLQLTKLYNWYGGDFEQAAGSVTRFAARYSTELEQALEAESTLMPSWLPYEWKLNSLENKQTR